MRSEKENVEEKSNEGVHEFNVTEAVTGRALIRSTTHLSPSSLPCTNTEEARRLKRNEPEESEESDTNENEGDQENRRLERNRAKSKKAREKKKLLLKHLEESLVKLTNENRTLKEENLELKARLEGSEKRTHEKNAPNPINLGTDSTLQSLVGVQDYGQQLEHEVSIFPAVAIGQQFYVGLDHSSPHYIHAYQFNSQDNAHLGGIN